MTLYLYRTGTAEPVRRFDRVRSYTDGKVVTDGGVYAPLAEDCELSSLPDCSETLRAAYRARNPGLEARLMELEDLLAELLYGGETT